MEKAASQLFLKGHQVRGVNIHGPVDLEIHNGTDGRIYVIDTARVFPPESPYLSVVKANRGIFYNLLRPELLLIFGKPLSSDSYTPWGSILQDEIEVESATKFLIETQIPKFSKQIQNSEFPLEGCLDLQEKMHKNGINLRYLGLIRTHVSDPFVRRLLLLEMITRVLAMLLRKKFREKSPSRSYINDVVDFLNLVLSKNLDQATEFWNSVKKQLLSKFGVGLTPDELDPKHHLGNLPREDIKLFISRFQEKTGVSLVTDESLLFEPTRRVIYPDILGINSITRNMNIVDYVEGLLLLEMASQQPTNDLKCSVLNLAKKKLVIAKSKATNSNPSIYFYLGKINYCLEKYSRVPLEKQNYGFQGMILPPHRFYVFWVRFSFFTLVALFVSFQSCPGLRHPLLPFTISLCLFLASSTRELQVRNIENLFIVPT